MTFGTVTMMFAADPGVTSTGTTVAAEPTAEPEADASRSEQGAR